MKEAYEPDGKMKMILVAGGAVTPEFLKRYSDPDDRRTCLVGIDAGVLRLEEAGLVPDVVIGDFDSVSPEERERIRKGYPQNLFLNPVKDDTDMEAAVRYAIEQRPEEILILGATGGRMDHTVTNLRLLVLFVEADLHAYLLDEHSRIRILKRSATLDKNELYGPYVSLLPVLETVRDITLRGFKYPLEQASLEPFSSLGVSNELEEETGEIIFSQGLLYLMETKDR